MVSVEEISSEHRPIQTVNPFISVSELLSQMDFSQIESHLHQHLGYALGRRWEYPPLVLFKLLIVKLFRKQSYRRLVNSLTKEDCYYLGLKEVESGRFLIPAASTVHDFAYNRLGLDGLKQIMHLNGSIACKTIRNANGMIDSTPIEASRYDKYARFNPHYECRMYKMHIFHLEDFPLYGFFSDGTDYDGGYAIPLSEKVSLMHPDLKTVKLDAGYDSYRNHAALWKILKVQPLIDQNADAVIQYEGTEERIDHWVNKLWKKGGNIHAGISAKLHFLYDNGREMQVGKYLRNKNLLDPNFKSAYKSRSDCERTHSHMKRMFTFTVKWIQQRSKEFYMCANFVAYQIVLIANLMRNVPDIQDMAGFL